MYCLEVRMYCEKLKSWQPWEIRTVFDKYNSKNPRKESLQTFEKLRSVSGEIWRVTHRKKTIIEQR